MTRWACVFVDGENLRHSLLELFAEELDERGRFQGRDLPADADWTALFDWVVQEGTNGSCERLRAYWYAIEHVDFYPYGYRKMLTENPEQLREILNRDRHFKKMELEEGVRELEERERAFSLRFNGWRSVHDGMARRHQALEFRRAGGIRYNLFRRSLGKEKAVDVKLACDLLTLRNTFEAAVIVSGDQDYVPAAQVLKDSGNRVINVAFEKRNGQLLPGGARRLNLAVDASINVPYDQMLEFMRLKNR